MSQGGLERGDHPTGVVFYLLREDQVPRDWSEKAAQRIAEIFANGFVVRFGMRDGEQPGTYWVGFNSMNEGGRYIEHYLGNRARKWLAQIKEREPGTTVREKDLVTVRRVFSLPGPVPHPPLRPVLPHLVASGEAPAPPPPPAPPAEERRPAAPTGRGGLMDQAAAAREKLRGEGVNLGNVVSGPAAKIPDEYRGRIPRLGRRRRQRGADEGS